MKKFLRNSKPDGPQSLAPVKVPWTFLKLNKVVHSALVAVIITSISTRHSVSSTRLSWIVTRSPITSPSVGVSYFKFIKARSIDSNSSLTFSITCSVNASVVVFGPGSEHSGNELAVTVAFVSVSSTTVTLLTLRTIANVTLSVSINRNVPRTLLPAVTTHFVLSRLI